MAIIQSFSHLRIRNYFSPMSEDWSHKQTPRSTHQQIHKKRKTINDKRTTTNDKRIAKKNTILALTDPIKVRLTAVLDEKNPKKWALQEPYLLLAIKLMASTHKIDAQIRKSG